MRAPGLALVVALVLSLGREAAALDNPFPTSAVISPGIKLGYTFGDDGGFTWGFELTALFRTGPDLGVVLAHGPAFNLTFGPVFHLRAGWEIVSWGLGLEAGPELVRGKDGSRFGFGVTPWLGAFFVAPYYTHTFVLDGEPVDEAGTYLKLPLCPGCSGGNGGGFDFDDDE